MPAKAPLDENVKFLFACLLRSDYKTVCLISRSASLGMVKQYPTKANLYQTQIDFTRVAADFSINPAAARMRWSRLKKNINPDDIASTLDSPAAKIKSPSKGHQLSEEIKEISKEMRKEKRAGRKAKTRAEHKIGVLVKNEEMQEEEEEAGASAGFEDNPYRTNATGSEGGVEVAQRNAGLPVFKMDDEYINNTALNVYQAPINSDSISDLLETVNQPTFGVFQLSPPITSNIFPAFVPNSQPSIIPPLEGEIETWGNTITIKREPEPTTVNPMFIASPVSSSSSFLPTPPMRASVSPPKVGMKQLAQKCHATNNSRVRKTRGRPRKNVGDENMDEDFKV